MENIIILPDEIILNKIICLRNQKVMLDKDLAVLFDVKPYRMREQIKRNKDKFPSHFMFQLNNNETNQVVSHFAIPSKSYFGGTNPYVFTEYGILQLSNVLTSDRATQMSIRIIEVFVKMREMILSNQEILLQLENLKKNLSEQDDRIDMIYNYLIEFIKSKNGNNLTKIGYKI